MKKDSAMPTKGLGPSEGPTLHPASPSPPGYGLAHHPPDEVKVRDRLIQAATELFARKGYAATRVSEIVGVAGVTKPILYYYFQHKEGLYLEILRDAYDRLDETLEKGSRRQGSALTRLSLLLGDILDLLNEKLDTARMIHSVYYGPPQGAPAFDFDAHRIKYHQTLQRIVEDGLEAGEFRVGNAMDITLAVAGMVSISMEMGLCAVGPKLDREGLERLLHLLFMGIAAGKVRREELLS